MKTVENGCVDCGLPCLGSLCPYSSVATYYCDECECDAEYRIDDNDYCKSCAEKLLQEVFDDLTVEEKAEMLDISCSTY